MTISIGGLSPVNLSTDNNVNQQVRFYVEDTEGNINNLALYVSISGSVIKGYGDAASTASGWEWAESDTAPLMAFTASHLSGNFFNYNDEIPINITYDITRTAG